MIISSGFYLLEAIEEAFYKENTHGCVEKFFMILCFPIWPVYSIVASSCKIFKSKIDSSDPEKEEGKIKKLTKMSNRGHLIEVCTESALQPLVQLYSIYIGLMTADFTRTNSDWKDTLGCFMSKFSKILAKPVIQISNIVLFFHNLPAVLKYAFF